MQWHYKDSPFEIRQDRQKPTDNTEINKKENSTEITTWCDSDRRWQKKNKCNNWWLRMKRLYRVEQVRPSSFQSKSSPGLICDILKITFNIGGGGGMKNTKLVSWRSHMECVLVETEMTGFPNYFEGAIRVSTTAS